MPESVFWWTMTEQSACFACFCSRLVTHQKTNFDKISVCRMLYWECAGRTQIFCKAMHSFCNTWVISFGKYRFIWLENLLNLLKLSNLPTSNNLQQLNLNISPSEVNVAGSNRCCLRLEKFLCLLTRYQHMKKGKKVKIYTRTQKFYATSSKQASEEEN